jgi:chromosome segregation ATPase
MEASTHLEALQAELLGDVGRVHDQIKELRSQIQDLSTQLPALTSDIFRRLSDLIDPQQAITTATKQAIEETTQSALAVLSAAADAARPMPRIGDMLGLVRDRLETLIQRFETLPQEAAAEAIAPGVRATIEGVRGSLENLQKEVEQAAVQAESGVERLTETGVAAIAEASAAADKTSRGLVEAQATLRKIIDRLPQAVAAATPSIAQAASSAVQRVEIATKAAVEGLAAATPRSNHRLTAIVAVAGFVAIAFAVHWHRPSNALLNWAASAAGRSAYAFAEANPNTIGMLEACDLPGWRRTVVHHRAACVVAGNRSRQYGWFLPQK